MLIRQREKKFSDRKGELIYAKTMGGLAASYAAALPFFQNTILGDLFYTAVLFGGLALAERCFPLLSGRPNYRQA